MLFLIVSRTRPALTAAEFKALGELAKTFYANIPEGITLHADWAAIDQSRTFALLEAENADAVEALQAPFRQYVDIDIVPVREINGWQAS